MQVLHPGTVKHDKMYPEFCPADDAEEHDPKAEPGMENALQAEGLSGAYSGSSR